MTTASLWAQIDPAAELAGVTGPGYDDGAADPSRQTVPVGTKPWSPSHQHFGFGATVAVTAGLLYYVFERGAGAGVRARVGNLAGGANLDLSGDKEGK